MVFVLPMFAVFYLMFFVITGSAVAFHTLSLYSYAALTNPTLGKELKQPNVLLTPVCCFF